MSMENQSSPFPEVLQSLTKSAANSRTISHNKEKWTKLKLFLFLLQSLGLLVHTASGQLWDGVVVTQADFQALQAFRQELIDPKGFLRGWNDSGYGACSGGWVGIKCAQGQVIVIQLPWKGLAGRISAKIGQLQALRKLSLHDNLIGGSIPATMGLLPNLRGLQLFNNRLSGSVPSSLGLCLLLQTLDLGNNLLTGTIPESISNSTKLYRLNLSFNSFHGSIPVSLTRSSSLIFLSLQYNNLSGAMPSTWGPKNGNSSPQLTKLQELSLSHNQITGTIPDEMGRLPSLKRLDLSHNLINGSLPVSFSNLSSLVLLNLGSNRLSNPIPEDISRLRNLSVLNLGRNNFNGDIPLSVGKMKSLEQLDLSLNNLTGEIPSSIGDLPNLKSLNVSYNNLSGSVPIRLAQKFKSSSFVGNLQLCGYSSSAPCSSPPPSPVTRAPSTGKTEKRHRRKLSTKDIILIAAGALLLVLFLLCCILLCCLIRRRRVASKSKNGRTAASTEKGAAPSAGGETGGKLVHFDGPMVFTADDLLCATAEIMGKSTYGTVYKATLEDGNQVAVKRLREKITKSQREFEVEVNLLGRIRHQNLLALRAYYLGPKGEKLLVFDYMPRGSLAAFLHARGPETAIDWPMRKNIIRGVTRGLFHLHANQNIIHGNLTSTNILLDDGTNAKIADFGLSRLMTAAANSNVIATAGALGYRAPELSKLKKANTKTDVYSLGVIILELLTGKSPGEAMNGVDLPHWVASVVKEEWTNEVFDVELMKDATAIGDELLNTLKLALHCVDPSPSARPEVQQVVQQLEEIGAEMAGSSGDDGAGGIGPSFTSD